MNTIRIHESTYQDVKLVKQLWSNPEVMTYVGFPDGLHLSDEAYKAWFSDLQNNPHAKHFVIAHEDYGFCGETFYHFNDSQHVQLDIKLLPHAWGLGIASYALTNTLVKVFSINPEAVAHVDPHVENSAAIALYKRLGFQDDFTQKQENNIAMVATWKQFKPSSLWVSDHVVLRQMDISDMEALWLLSAKEPHYLWQDTNGPYFGTRPPVDYQEFMEKRAGDFVMQDDIYGIFWSDQLIGTLSYYFESEITRWLEMGCVLYNEHFWHKGITTAMLPLWMGHLFTTMEIDRVGFTTWSKNYGMIRAGQKCAMKQEAALRRVRYYQGTYYDSIKFGLTKTEWQQQQNLSAIEVIRHVPTSQKITREILESLPEWFGIPEAIDEYVEGMEMMEVAVYYEDGLPVGFIALNRHKQAVIDIHVMAVIKSHQGKGIGTLLVQWAIFQARKKGIRYLSVKTLDETHPDLNYKKTRAFYQHAGFVPFESFPTLWGAENPCLVMIQTV